MSVRPWIMYLWFLFPKHQNPPLYTFVSLIHQPLIFLRSSCCFARGFLSKTSYSLPIFPIRATYPAHHNLHFGTQTASCFV
jgi:hypothetical protein